MPDLNKIALIIGIDAYYHKGLDGKPSLVQLPSCKNDAMDLSNLLESEIFGYKVFTDRAIIGSELDEQNGFLAVHRAVKSFFNDAELGNLLLFYFSGHGIPRHDGEVYLATPQVDPKDPLIEGFRLSDLTSLVNSSRARRIICIIDSCYSGAANPDDSSLNAMSPEEGDNKTVESAKYTSNRILNNLLRNEGRYFLLSTQSYSRSYAPKDNNTNSQRNSFFTKYLIEGIKGIKPDIDEEGRIIPYTGSVDDNGYVTPESLYRYVWEKVRIEVPHQDPVIKSTSSGDIIKLVSYPALKTANIAELISAGNQYLSDKKYEDAIKKFDEIISLVPRSFFAYKSKGDALVKLKKDVEALNCYAKALEIKPDYAYALRDKGLALSNLSKYDEAIEFYDNALKNDPEDSLSWNYKGLAFSALGKYNEAITYFDRAYHIDPNFTEAIKNKEFCLKITQIKVAKASDEATFSDEVWEDLLYNIGKLPFLPIIGNGVCSPFLPSFREIAENWVKEYRYPFGDSADLARISEFLAINRSDPIFPKDKIRREFEKVIPPDFSSEELRNTPHAVLADLNLPIYITTNYDHFMEAALRSKGKEPVSEFCRWNEYTFNLARSTVWPKYKPSPSNPLVYHLYGSIEVPQSMVLTDSDHNQFEIGLYRNDIKLPGVVNFGLKYTPKILFIGYDIEDSGSRILQILFHANDENNAYMVLLPPKEANNEEVRRYMANYAGPRRVYWGSASSFCYELRKRWEKWECKLI